MKQKTNTITKLRDKVLEAFSNLESGKIDCQSAGVIAKLSETVISGLKTQMDYARLTNSDINIPFLEDGVIPYKKPHLQLLKNEVNEDKNKIEYQRDKE